MRANNLIFILIIILAIRFTYAQNNGSADRTGKTTPVNDRDNTQSVNANGSSVPQPDIYFKEKSYDFGAVGQDEEVTHEFEFENRGDAVLKIKAVKATCGCAAILLSSKEVAPGKTGIIEVKLRTKKLRGKIVKGISVHSNDPDEPKVNLEIKGKVKLGIAIEPENIFFMDIPKGRSAKRRFKVIQVEKKELVVKKIEANSNYFTTEFQKLKDEKVKGFEATVTLKPTAPVGTWSEVITIHTNLPNHPRIDVPVICRIMGVVTVTPTICNLGIVKKGVSAQRKVVVSTTSRQPLRILDIKSTSPALSVETNPIKEGKRYEVLIKLAKDAPAGRFRGVVDIHTNIPGESLIEVAVYGLIKK